MIVATLIIYTHSKTLATQLFAAVVTFRSIYAKNVAFDSKHKKYNNSVQRLNSFTKP